MPPKKSIAEAGGSNPQKPWKATLFESSRLFLGVNCLEPGQKQPVHVHAGQDKFYLVHEGRGRFTVGVEVFEAGAGDVVWTPAEVPHGVENHGSARLTMVMGMAPAPARG